MQKKDTRYGTLNDKISIMFSIRGFGYNLTNSISDFYVFYLIPALESIFQVQSKVNKRYLIYP
jgi:hypothetical protein